jgi:alanine racemase
VSGYQSRSARAEIDLGAVAHNVRLLVERAAPAALCAVVKADGYGHGALACARAAQAAGATWLAVATAEEAAGLRRAGIDGPILVLGALSHEELELALAARADVVAWSEPFVERLAGRPEPVCVHVKFDTGMGRLGTRERDRAMAVAERVLAGPSLALVGAMTHFATSDDDLEFLDAQLQRFVPFVGQLRRRCPGLVVHAANSAATLRAPESHFDLVRCGIALYGCDPMQSDPVTVGLEPALELRSYVAAVKRAYPGDSAGYGRRFIAEQETWLATVPIGYADGVRRGLTNNCEVLIGGARYPLVGTVSMDNITVEVEEAGSVKQGMRATIIGANGPEHQSAEELAARIGTINYEIVCGISARVPRSYHRDGVPA